MLVKVVEVLARMFSRFFSLCKNVKQIAASKGIKDEGTEQKVMQRKKVV